MKPGAFERIASANEIVGDGPFALSAAGGKRNEMRVENIAMATKLRARCLAIIPRNTQWRYG